MVKQMAKSRKTHKKIASNSESDEQYFLKLVLYLVTGAFWLRLENFPDWQIPIPLGLLIGLWFATRDRFQIDRKIEYALLLVASFVGFWLPLGLSVRI